MVASQKRTPKLSTFAEHTLRRTWPDLFATELRRVTGGCLQRLAAAFREGGSTFLPKRAKVKKTAGNSPTPVNGTIAFLQRIFAIGVKAGISDRNPAQDLERKPAKKKLLRLPNRSQFAAIVGYIRRQPGWDRIAGDLVEGLAYSGMRVGESRRLTWSHLDF